MTAGDKQTLLRAAIAAVRDCAAKMEERAKSLLQSLPKLPMDEGLKATAVDLIAGLNDTSGRVTFELALLQAELGEDKVNTATAVQRLSSMDATMMGALGRMTDIADVLEMASERDEENERAFVLVIEATGVMMQSLEKARAATQALSAGMRTPARK
jgi:hypothetical protein